MTKLLITEITRMGPAFCVIGLQREEEKVQSVRPIPASGHSWLHFPHRRGDVLDCALAPFPAVKPHIEDRTATRGFQKSSSVAEAETVAYLRKAEMADSLLDLFGCAVHENRKGAGLHAMPNEARRSICGCETQNLRLELYANELRATLALLPEKSCATFPLSTATGVTSSMRLSLPPAEPIAPPASSVS